MILFVTRLSRTYDLFTPTNFEFLVWALELKPLFWLALHELRNGLCSPWSLCGSVVEHRSTEPEGLWFDSSWKLNIFFVPRSWQDEKTSFTNFFTELET